MQRNQAVKLSSLTIDQVSVPGHNHRLYVDQQAVRYHFTNWDKSPGWDTNQTGKPVHGPTRPQDAFTFRRGSSLALDYLTAHFSGSSKHLI